MEIYKKRVNTNGNFQSVGRSEVDFDIYNINTNLKVGSYDVDRDIFKSTDTGALHADSFKQLGDLLSHLLENYGN